MDVTNPEKLIYPDAGVTKADLVGYYESVASTMLPDLIGRPLTLQRFPNGVAGNGFMQKNASPHFPTFIERIELPKADGTVLYPAVNSEEGLAYLANQGTVTFHIPSSRKPHLDMPDRIVFDLDPPEGAVDLVRSATKALRELLQGLGVEPLLMASGSKGYHLVINTPPEHLYERVSPWAQAVAAVAEKAHPELFTSKFLVRNRGGLVFLDWMRNHWGATTVAPYSLRPRAEATVAAPLEWSELDSMPPNGIVWNAVGDRLDTWADVKPVNLESAYQSVEDLVASGEVELRSFDRFGRS